MTIVMVQRARSETRLGPPDFHTDVYQSSEPAAVFASRLRGLIEDIVSNVFAVEAEHLRRATRGRAKIALARQVAMYIAHVGYGMSLTEVGRLFDRDTTTVAHACSVVEVRRDDAEFDEAVMLLELIVRAVNGSCGLTDAGVGLSTFGST